MMSESKVTILLPTYNRREFLPKALEDLKKQTFREWTCLIVNDGGESVADIVAAAQDERFELHERPHLGKPAQLNWALGQVKTKFVTYADDDDEIYPIHLETLFAAAQRSEAGFACTRMKTTWVDPEGRVLSEIPASAERICFETLRYCHNACGVAQQTVFHSLELARRAGGYDESMQVLIDYDFIRRLVRLAEPVVVDTVTVNHIMRRKRAADGKLASISGLWWRDPEAAGRSLLAFFEKDPASLTRLYLDAGEGLAASRRLEKITTSLAWRISAPLRKLVKLMKG